MEFLKIQTESFYKFMTLVGTLILVFSNTYFPNKLDEISIEQFNLIKDYKISTEKNKQLVEQYKEEFKILKELSFIAQKIEEKIDALNKIMKNREPKNNISESEKILREIKELNAELDLKKTKRKLQNDPMEKNLFKTNDIMNIEKIELESRKGIYDYHKSQLAFWNRTYYLGQFIGSLLLIIGAIKWKKIQDVQDKILNYQFLMLKKKNQNLLEEIMKTGGEQKKGLIKSLFRKNKRYK